MRLDRELPALRYGPIVTHFRPRRHRLGAQDYRQTHDQCFATWCEVTGVISTA